MRRPFKMFPSTYKYKLFFLFVIFQARKTCTRDASFKHSFIDILLDEIILERPEDIEQHLCADKTYSGEPALKAILSKRYIPHVKTRGKEIQEKATNPNWKARRWVVEESHSWFNRFRKILVRYKKLAGIYMALLHMAATIIAYRKVDVIYG